MKSVPTFLKKYGLFIFLALLATALVGLKLTSRSIPETPSIPTPSPSPSVLPYPAINGQLVDFSISFTHLEDQNLPAFLPLYKKENVFLSSEEARSIAKKLGFVSESQITRNSENQNIFSWAQESDFLTINLHLSEITLVHDPFIKPFPKSSNPPDPEEGQKQFVALLANLNLATSFDLTELQITYLQTSGPHLEPTTKTTADILRVGANPLVDGKKVLSHNPQASSLFVLMDRQGDIAGFEYHLPFRSLSKETDYPLKNLQEVSEAINQEGVIVSTDTGSEYELEINLQKGELSFEEVIYFYDYANDFIQPVYLFSGQGQTAENETVSFEVYLPAIKSNLLRNQTREHFKTNPPVNPLGL